MPLDNYTTKQLLSELTTETFNSGPRVIPGQLGKFDAVFTHADYLLCLQTMAHLIVGFVEPHSLIRVMKGHAEVPVLDYCTEVATAQKAYLALNMDHLGKVVAGGGTVNLNMLERLSTRFRVFSRALEVQLGCRLQTNLYYNEGHIAGFFPHYDTHDLFVWQISGEKRWQISYDVVPNVSIATPSRPENAPTIWDEDVVLSEGDMIALPRGTWHSVTGVGKPSLHLTVGMRTPTFEDYLRWLGSHAGASSTLRMRVSSPGHCDPAESAAILMQGLAELTQRGVTFERFVAEYAYPPGV